MAKRTHDTQSVFNMLNKQEAQETQQKHDIQSTQTKRPQGRPRLSQEEKKGGYRYNLNLDKDLKNYVRNKAWQDRKSVTDYINDLIRADRDAYIANGGSMEGWIDFD